MSKKIILRQSVKSGVAVVFFFGLGMASINAQTTQTTQPTGKVGINTTNPTETLDVKGKVRIQELYTDNQQTGTNNNATFTATNVVTVDNNGVLGKKPLSSIIMPTIPTEPWRQLGSTTQATANTDNIYQNGKVGIGNYASTSTFDSDFEVNSSHNGYHVGIANGADTKWNLSAESGDERAFTITKRHKDGAGRLLSITKEAKLFLGNTLTTAGGGNTKITLDGKDGNIILVDKWRVGLKGNSLMFYNSSTTGDSNNKFTLTNEGKLFLGKDLNGDGNGTGANILLDGKDGKVAIGHNNPAEALDVKGKAKIQTIEKQTATTGLDMVVVGTDGVLKKAAIPTSGGSGNGVKNHTGSNDAVQCNAANAGTIHYKEEVLVNNNKTSVMGFCMKTAGNKYRWFYIFGGAGTTAGSEADAPNFGEGIQ